MTAAALAGDASDLSQNGLSISNAVNTGFDVVSSLPALSWLRYAPSVVLMLLKVFIRMPLIHGVMLRERLILPNKVLSED